MKPDQPPEIFSAAARLAKRRRGIASFADADFLHRAAADDIVDRLESILRPFNDALLFGGGSHLIADQLTSAADVHGITTAAPIATDRVDTTCTADALPFEDASFDLVVSLMELHAVNDVPGALREIRRVLRPDGLLIATFPGERTLTELRASLQSAEAEVTGRVASRVFPQIAVKDGGALLQHAGFAMPVADVQHTPISYASPMDAMRDLRTLGETNALTASPRGSMRKDVFLKALAHYKDHYSDDDRILVTVDLVTLTGWAPHASQPKPLKPGSGKTSLATVFKQDS